MLKIDEELHEYLISLSIDEIKELLLVLKDLDQENTYLTVEKYLLDKNDG